MTPTWSDGTPKSTNNAFTVPSHRTKPPAKNNPNRIKLTKVEAAAVTFMSVEESRAFREQIKQKRGLT
jgi:hypothetical protein